MTAAKPSRVTTLFREFRATAVAAATIWSLLVTTGTLEDFLPPQTETVTAVVEEAADGGLTAVPLPDAAVQFDPVVIAPDPVVLDCPFEGGCDGVGQAWVDEDGAISAVGVPVTIEADAEPVLREVVFTEFDMEPMPTLHATDTSAIGTKFCRRNPEDPACAPPLAMAGPGDETPPLTDAVMSGEEVVIVAPAQDNLPMMLAAFVGVLAVSVGIGRAWTLVRRKKDD